MQKASQFKFLNVKHGTTTVKDLKSEVNMPLPLAVLIKCDKGSDGGTRESLEFHAKLQNAECLSSSMETLGRVRWHLEEKNLSIERKEKKKDGIWAGPWKMGRV